jgi:hypothetical protein
MQARAEDVTIRIPPIRTSVTVENQAIAVAVSGVITRTAHDRTADVFRLEIAGDLADVQEHATELLRAQLNRDERCGERIDIQRATLVPRSPAAVLTVQLHYERWGCAKAFGKQIVKRLAGGNGTVEVKLTPAIEQGKAVRLDPEVGAIDADGSLGDLLRSGQLGDALREKIVRSLTRAMQPGTNLGTALPPAVQQYVTLQEVRFAPTAAGRLGLALTGEVRMPAAQAEALLAQLKVAAGQ